MGKKAKGEPAKKPAAVSQEQLRDIDDLFAAAKSKKRSAGAAESDCAPAATPSSSGANAAKIPKLDLPKDIIKGGTDAPAVKKKRAPLRAAQPVPEDSHSGPYGVIKSARYGIPVKIISPEAPLERIDAESGLPVYKAHILKVGDGGGTPLCPFDCDCCF